MPQPSVSGRRVKPSACEDTGGEDHTAITGTDLPLSTSRAGRAAAARRYLAGAREPVGAGRSIGFSLTTFGDSL
jgi:hypothetical protein